MKPRLTALLGLCSLVVLSGCGETRIERVGSGAVIGGAVGTGVGFACCINPGAGLAIGAASGAVVGGLLSEPIFFNYHDDDWPYGN